MPFLTGNIVTYKDSMVGKYTESAKARMGMGKGRTGNRHGPTPWLPYQRDSVLSLFKSWHCPSILRAAYQPYLFRIGSFPCESVSDQSAQFLFTAYLVLPEVPAAKN